MSLTPNVLYGLYYESPFLPLIKTESYKYEILSHNYEILSHNCEIVIHNYEIICFICEIIGHNFEILYGLLFLLCSVCSGLKHTAL